MNVFWEENMKKREDKKKNGEIWSFYKFPFMDMY